MSPLSGLLPFVHVAEKKSFRAAASQLGVTPTAVSKAVAALEAELGVRLLNRTTRHVALTAEGATYLRHCREALDRIQAGRDLITQSAQLAQGRLKVSLSFVLGRPVVAALPRLLSRHPRIQVHLSFSDSLVNLVEQEVDVAIRIGPATDSALIGRRLRTPSWVTVAAPDYVARVGEPGDVGELTAHTCLQFARPNGQVAGWRFAGREAAAPYLAERPILFDHGDLLVDAAVAGLGVAQVFDFMVRDQLAKGELVVVLPKLATAGPPVYALSLPGRQRAPKIRAFLDFIVEVLGRPEEG